MTDATHYLALEALTLSYGKAAAVRNLDLAVAKGELVSLLGPSGCGKTTTMRAIAGLLAPVSGRIVLAGSDITRLATHRRDIGLVFQSYALFPHLSVWDNVAFGLHQRKVHGAELEQRVRDALRAVGLADFAPRLPAQLSGGQQQRVALARAIVIRPRLLLLDEPLSNLDAKLRVEMRAELRRLQRETGITMVYVTHDQDEALGLSDRIVIMREGRIEQNDTPQAIYHRPATAFVASFMGYDNLFDAATTKLPFALPPGARHVAWRPDAVTVTAAGATGDGHVAGRVLARSYRGDSVEFLVDTALGKIKGSADALSAPWAEGDTVSMHLDPARAALIPT